MPVETVTWYVRGDAALDGLPQRWLAACRAHLLEAVPLRYGDREPLRGRWHTGGNEDGLVAAHARATQLFALGYDGTPGPTGVRVFGAGFPVTDRAAYLGDAGAVRLHVAAGSFTRIEPFVLAVARGPGTIAVVLDAPLRWTWTGRTLFGQESVSPPFLAPLGRWQGLPPERPPWCWLGPAYARALRRALPGTDVAGGLVPDAGTWAPPAWCARPDEIEPSRREARRMPRPVRPPPAWRHLLRRPTP